MPVSDSSREILHHIDREIAALLREGKLSPLDYGLPVSQHDRTHRSANLKALLAIRKHYRANS